MLRLLDKNGKALSLKEQEKLCKEDKTQLVNPALPARSERKTKPKYPGLRPSGGSAKVVEKKDVKGDKKDVKTA